MMKRDLEKRDCWRLLTSTPYHVPPHRVTQYHVTLF